MSNEHLLNYISIASHETSWSHMDKELHTYLVKHPDIIRNAFRAAGITTTLA